MTSFRPPPLIGDYPIGVTGVDLMAAVLLSAREAHAQGFPRDGHPDQGLPSVGYSIHSEPHSSRASNTGQRAWPFSVSE